MARPITRRTLLALLAGAAIGGPVPGGEREMERIEQLIALFHRRWACPVLAELARTEGAKFVTLVHKLESSPGAMREALDTLIDLDWIRRNPGYGHPMRPEYILTRRGEKLAPVCLRLEGALGDLGARAVARRKWSMPVLHAVGEGPTRFSEIPRLLTGITDRALSIALRDLSGAAVVARHVLDSRPPVSAYAATPSGRKIVPILEELC